MEYDEREDEFDIVSLASLYITAADTYVRKMRLNSIAVKISKKTSLSISSPLKKMLSPVEQDQFYRCRLI